ncbi:MAG: hypothetical protein ACKVRN_06065 [Pyrinomonadaceae bacterium]
MNKKLLDGRFHIVSSVLVFSLLIGIAFGVSAQDIAGSGIESGTFEKMIVANGNVTMEVDVNRLSGANASARKTTLGFSAVEDTFFAILVLNGELRGPVPSSMEITPSRNVTLPAPLNASYRQLVIESLPWGGNYELAVRDKNTGFTYFNIEGQLYNFDPNQRVFSMEDARLLISPEFAAALGRPSDAGVVIGTLNANANMRAIEVAHVTNGEVTQNVLPPMERGEAGTRPGPDVVVGDLSGLAQFGSSFGTQVGLAVGTDSCNFGTIPLNWFANPNNDHPVIPQNLYRMSGGATNNERFEQIGQSQMKHAFTALQNNICSLGCNSSGTGTLLGSGCSDPYGASLNSGPSLGSRAWVNPFTGFFPTGTSTNNSHTGHTHNGPTHRVLTEIADLNTSLNAGATYFAEAQYITPHEYAWCQSNPGQCNMYNNSSYRQYNVSGTGSPFSFSAAGSTVREKPAVEAWTGSTRVTIEPERGLDGVAILAYKVTQPSAGVWHYEYALYNQNLDRGIRLFSVPVGTGVSVTNIGFHAPPQHPGSGADGTMGDAGYSSTPWTTTLSAFSMMWNTETFAQNPNANAIRWGTMYNFRFDANQPPATMYATVGFYKNGTPIQVLVQGPRSTTPSPCARVISASSNPCSSSN